MYQGTIDGPMKYSAPCQEPKGTFTSGMAVSKVQYNSALMRNFTVASCTVKAENSNKKGRGEGGVKRQL